jgi:hypothetical protein
MKRITVQEPRGFFQASIPISSSASAAVLSSPKVRTAPAPTAGASSASTYSSPTRSLASLDACSQCGKYGNQLFACAICFTVVITLLN